MSRLHTLSESTSLCHTGSPDRECRSCIWSAINSKPKRSICVSAFRTNLNKISNLNRITSEALG